MTKSAIVNTLQSYLPEKAVEDIADILIANKVQLSISRSRNTKFGDFKAPTAHLPARLSINHDLNPYAFLITLLHEIAHLRVWDRYQIRIRKLKPHGNEWKKEFQQLISPFLNAAIFPSDVLYVLKKHMLNPKASTSSDIKLLQALKKHDKNKQSTLLADLNINDIFIFRGDQFKLIKKNRSRYICKHLQSKQDFSIHSLIEIEAI